MRKECAILMLLAWAAGAYATPPEILVEACQQFSEPAKQQQCLRAVREQDAICADSARMGGANSRADADAAYVAPDMAQPLYAAPKRARRSSSSSSSSTCYVGPRGGTYTITRSGKKNYGGC